MVRSRYLVTLDIFYVLLNVRDKNPLYGIWELKCITENCFHSNIIGTILGIVLSVLAFDITKQEPVQLGCCRFLLFSSLSFSYTIFTSVQCVQCYKFIIDVYNSTCFSHTVTIACIVIIIDSKQIAKIAGNYHLQNHYDSKV